MTKQRSGRFTWKLGDVTIVPPTQHPTKEGTVKKISPAAGVVVRVARLTNPRTKRTVYERVTADGRLSKRAAKVLGTKKVASWIEVTTKAGRWSEATKAIKAGRGKTVRLRLAA